jgi:hypothetical protein
LWAGYCRHRMDGRMDSRRCATGALSPDRPLARSSQRRSTPPPTSGEGLFAGQVSAAKAAECTGWVLPSPTQFVGEGPGMGGARRVRIQPATVHEPQFTSPRGFWGRSRGDEREGAPRGARLYITRKSRPRTRGAGSRSSSIHRRAAHALSRWRSGGWGGRTGPGGSSAGSSGSWLTSSCSSTALGNISDATTDVISTPATTASDRGVGTW